MDAPNSTLRKPMRHEKTHQGHFYSKKPFLDLSDLT